MNPAPGTAYPKSPDHPRPERWGASRRRVIEEAKDKVSTIDLADLLCSPGKLRRVGAEWVGHCPLPDHEDRVPSFAVNPGKNVWFCHGCLRGGDVVELARHGWGYTKAEVAMAAADLLHEFGHPIPERPQSWHRKQARQQPVRDAIEATKIHAAQRRVYRRYFEPAVLATEDEEDRAHDAQLFWEASAPLAEHLVGSIMRSGR